MGKEWWKKSVVYQIYPQSFQDSNGDGFGDINGIRKRLPYLAELGVDLVWICPIFKSPMVDNGYDIADYYSVDQRFGTNADLMSLIKEATTYGIKLILDLVINHCSDQHPWFQKAIADPQCEEASFFYFKHTDNDSPPNNWRSNFGGSAWSQLPDGRWYYHTFSPQQPDLNWENSTLRNRLYEMINWWLKQGIAGFRVDAITFIKKDLTFASRTIEDGNLYPVENFENYPGISTFLNELKEKCFEQYNCVTVAEAPGITLKDIGEYSGTHGFFSMCFDFAWINMMGENKKSSFETIDKWKKRIFASQMAFSRNGWSGLCLENHDQPRCANKFLDNNQINTTSLSALATLYMFMYGTPFIYQGQEIGMTNAIWKNINQFQDVSAHIFYREQTEKGSSDEDVIAYLCEYGRDNGRTPFQWDSTTNAGFSGGNPWLKVNDNYLQINAQEQRDNQGSLFHCYRRLIALRKHKEYADVFAYGTFQPVLEDYKGVIAYERVWKNWKITIVVNFVSCETCVEYPFTQVLFDNYSNLSVDHTRMLLKPHQAIVLIGKR